MDSLGEERCWAEIDLGAIRANARVARERAGEGTELLAVVKANAYGHGLVPVAQALRGEATLFGVANLHEGIELRAGGITEPVLILGPALPNERTPICENGFIPSVSTAEEARAFTAAGGAVDFVIDTGMGRMGCWEDDAVAELEKLARIPQLQLHSISSHLPSADEDAAFTREELAHFDEFVRQAYAIVPGNWKTHILCSAGVLGFGPRPREIIRAGLMLYGSSPLPNEQAQLRPALTWKARVALLRDLPAGRSISYGRTFITPRAMRVATISAGYADGYPRIVSGRGASVLIRGKRCPVLGRVTMDLTMVDVSDLPEVQPNDEVVLVGRQGDEEILAAELAERAGTIAWEIFTGIGSRVRRVYL